MDTTIPNMQDAIDTVSAKLETNNNNHCESAWDDIDVETASDDDSIITRIKARDREAALWCGDASAYADDESRADLALTGYIASQTRDRQQIHRIFRQSGLMRPKWDEKRGAKTYGEMTIDKALEGKTESSPASPPASYPLTDVGNGEFFAAKYGRDCRWVDDWKSWIVWDGKRWVRDIGGSRVQRRAKRLVRIDMLDHAKMLVDGRDAYIKHALKSQSANAVENLLKMAKSDLTISPNDLDRDRMLLNIQNGTIDLRTGTVREHRREDLITKMSPFVFDASATSPTWDAYVHKTFEGREDEAELIDYVMRAAAYSLTGDCSEKALFIPYGPSNTGKTTFIDMLLYMMGDYAIVAQQSLVLQVTDRNKTNGEDEANLFGVRFASISETGDGQRLDEAKMKRLVNINGTKLRARYLYANSFEFEQTHKLWIDCNHKPKIRGGSDDAVWNRIKLIPFINVVPVAEQDRRLHEKLKNESSGILNRLLASLAAWRERGLSDEPREVRAAVNQYREESDDFGQFVREFTVNNDAGRVSKQGLYAIYTQYCEDTKQQPKNAPTFTRLMAQRGYNLDKGRRYYLGLQLAEADAKTEAETEAESQNAVEEPPF